MTIGEKILQLRKQNKWSQDYLGEQIGIYGRRVSLYENSKSIPSTETIQKLAEVFEVSIDYLLDSYINTELSFGKKLAKLRREKGITQDELGKLVGVHGRSIGKYEINQSFPTRNTLKKLVEIFEVPAEYFLSDISQNIDKIYVTDQSLLPYIEKLNELDEDSKKLVLGIIDKLWRR